VGRALEYNLTTLRVSRAYVSLLSRPEGDTAAVSLAWIGDYEIRMHAPPPTAAALELARVYINSSCPLIPQRRRRNGYCWGPLETRPRLSKH